MLYLQGAGFLEAKAEGGDGEARLSAAEWLGRAPSDDMDTSDEEVDRAAELEKKTGSIDDTLEKGIPRCPERARSRG